MHYQCREIYSLRYIYVIEFYHIMFKLANLFDVGLRTPIISQIESGSNMTLNSAKYPFPGNPISNKGQISDEMGYHERLSRPM